MRSGCPCPWPAGCPCHSCFCCRGCGPSASCNEGSGCGEEKFPDHDVLSSDAKGCGHQRTAWGRVPVKRKSSLIPLLWEENSRDFQDHEDRKSTRLNSSTNAHLVCRLLLEKKKNTTNIKPTHSTTYEVK